MLSGILIQFAQGTATVQLADGSQLKAAVSVSDVSPGTPVSLGIRPEALGLHGTETNSIKGTVSLVEQLGDHALVHMDWHETADAIVMRTEGNDLPRVGERLEPTFTPEACYLFTQDGRAFARIEQ